jgi:hypothetical protein
LRHRLGERLCRGQGVNGYRHARLVHQGQEALDLLFSDDRVGDEDVFDPAFPYENLRFAELCARQADGSGRDLHPGDLDGLVGFCVRPQ